jgi:hypothetical protein
MHEEDVTGGLLKEKDLMGWAYGTDGRKRSGAKFS